MTQHIAVDGSIHYGPSHPCGTCDEMEKTISQKDSDKPDMVNHPPHYARGPLIKGYSSLYSAVEVLECIEVIRGIKDMRLATAVKYIWRVAFGGKRGTDDREDIQKAIWYLNDWLENKVD